MRSDATTSDELVLKRYVALRVGITCQLLSQPYRHRHTSAAGASASPPAAAPSSAFFEGT